MKREISGKPREISRESNLAEVGRNSILYLLKVMLIVSYRITFTIILRNNKFEK